MGRMLMWAGGLLFVVGAAVHFGGRFFALGRLPGDIVVQKDNFTFYFPLATSILVSLVLTGLLWLLRKL